MSEVCPGQYIECPVWRSLDIKLQAMQVEAGFLIEASKEEIITEDNLARYLDIASDTSQEEREALMLLAEDDSLEASIAFANRA